MGKPDSSCQGTTSSGDRGDNAHEPSPEIGVGLPFRGAYAMIPAELRRW